MIPKIVDNFLTKEELSCIQNDVNVGCSWSLQSSLSNGITFLMHDLTSDFYTKKLFSKIQDEVEEELEIQRVYFNGQFCGREGKLHKDGCDLTALLYISEYNPDWGGFTQIVHSVTNQTIVPPVQKRLLIMSGMEYHKGYSYAYQTNPMRVSLAYKLNIK